MRILLYGLNMSPEPIGVGKYTGELAAWLAAEGHDVRVIAAPPYYPDWQVATGYSAFSWRTETVDGVRIVRCPIYVPSRPGGWKRVPHLASFAASSLPVALWQALTWRPDVVFCVEPTLLAAPGGLLAGLLGGARTWLHVQDFEIDAAFDLGLLKGGWLKRLTSAIDSFLLRRFDGVSSISDNMCQRLKDKGVAEDRAQLFANWIDPDVIYPLQGASPLRRELGIPDDAVTVLYSGNVNEKQGIGIIIDVARRLAEEAPNIRFVVAGGGAGWSAFQRQAAELRNILTIPLQPMEKLNDLLNLGDIHVLPQRADAADLVMPSKLTGMMGSGRPVVAAAASGTQLAGVVEGCGVVVPPEDMGAMAESIKKLAFDSILRTELGNAGRKRAVSFWGKNEVLARFLATINKHNG